MEKFLGIEWYHIRITKMTELEKIEEFVNKELKINVYLISKETLPQIHFHICIKTQIKEKTLREVLKKSEYGGRCKYYLKPSVNPKQMLKYTLKDGDFVYKGIGNEEIEILKKCSNKKGLDKFGIELQIIEEEFLTGKYSFTDFGTKFVELKISYGQNLYSSHIKAYLQKMRFKKNPDYIHQYVYEMFNRL